MATSGASDDHRITQALRQLDSNKPTVVAKAAQQLMKLAPGDPRIEAALLRRLDDTCLRVRAIAANALGELKAARRMHKPGASTILVTATNLAGKSYRLRVCPSYNVAGLKEVLAEALGTPAENLTLTLGTEVMEDAWLLREHGVHADAALTFVKRSEAEEAKPDASIEPLIQRLNDKNEESKMESLLALGRVAPTNVSLVEPLLRCLEREFLEGGSFKVAVKVAQFLFELDHDNVEFAGILAHGFAQELNWNVQYFARQNDPLHRLDPLHTMADILARLMPDNVQVLEMVRYSMIFRLRVLGGLPHVKGLVESVIGHIQVDDPTVKDSFFKVLRKQTQWDVLMSAARNLLKLPIDDLRMVERLLTQKGEAVPRRKVQNGAAHTLEGSSLLRQSISNSTDSHAEIGETVLASQDQKREKTVAGYGAYSGIQGRPMLGSPDVAPTSKADIVDSWDM